MSTLRRFLGFYKPHAGLFVLDMGVAVLASLLAVFFPYLTRTLLSVHIPARDLGLIGRTLILMLLIYLVKSVLTWIRIKWGHALGVRMETDMRRDLFGHIQKLSFSYYDTVKTGHIMSRISNDLSMIAEVAHHAPEDLFISLIVICGAFGFMFHFNAPLAAISAIPLPFILVWGWTLGLKMRGTFRQVRREIADINSTVENSVQGIREVKAFANERLEEHRFHMVNRSFQTAKEKAYALMAFFHAGMNFLRDFYYLLVVGGGVWLIYTGRIQVVDLLSFILYVGIILPPIDRLIQFMEQYQQGTASFERFVEIMDEAPEIQDKKNARALKKTRGRIAFESVFFRYAASPDWILKDINLAVEPGERVALVGESGAGKSSLVALIPRFYEVNTGVILIDEWEIGLLKQRSLRKHIGIVQQDVFLFDGTIRDNIMYGSPGASDRDLVEAARQANIFDFIESLPEGFDTEVGERGVKLSGGQKQRVSIARVFLKDPQILIFDEATSSLDSESEALIQEAMFKLSEHRTTIIIAHRLSTVKNVDRIYVMREGRIVEIGDHPDLVEQGGYYHSLYTRNLL